MNTGLFDHHAAELAPAGLKGVLVAETELGSVKGDLGFYHYRQHDAAALSTDRSLEAIWHMLVNGAFPDADSESDWIRRIGLHRVLEPGALEMAHRIGTHVRAPHLGLLASLPLVAGEGVSWLDHSHDEFRADLERLAGAVPTLLGAVLAGQANREPLNGDPKLSHAQDWVRLATGKGDMSVKAARMVEVYLALTVDHGFNASTFASRVTASAGSDAAACLASGVATLSGPLHGGAPSRALEMIYEIGDPERTEVWIRNRLDANQKIMGFGHAVYQAGDPRSEVLRQVASSFGGDLVEKAQEIERRALAELRSHRPNAVIVTNVEFYAGVVMAQAGLPVEAFTPSFTVSRAIGWSAHIAEQVRHNKIFRPSARYIGPAPAS